MNTPDDFYIGWMPAAPGRLARFTRLAWMLVLMAVAGLAVVLALGQRLFSASVFEYGQLTEVNGYYSESPVPMVRVVMPPGMPDGRQLISIPLVGYGKHGALDAIRNFEKEKGTKMDGRPVRFRGTLLYGEGKTLLQIDRHDAGYMQFGDTSALHPPAPVRQSVENRVWRGEILDPKCYFGVMKPGRGKPHRDCAIRCLEGGMSPVFRMTDSSGKAYYALLLGPNGQAIRQSIKNRIADPVELEARCEQVDDWLVLYVKDPAAIRRIGGAGLFSSGAEAVSCIPH